MPSNIVKSFSKQSGKSEEEVERIWKELKSDYGEDYAKIVKTLKKILKIDESKVSSFREFLKESKNVGDIYHFTTLKSLLHLIDLKKQSQYDLDVFEFFSHNNAFSCTRDGCLAQNILSRDINIKKGYFVRITLDGNTISNNYKIRPINGFDSNFNNGKRIGKEYQEREERIEMKTNNVNKEKTFKALNYIKEIVLLNDIKHDSLFNTKIEDTLNKLNIKFRFVRKFNEITKTDEGYDDLNIQSHDYEILL